MSTTAARRACCSATASPAVRSHCGHGPSISPTPGLSVSLPRLPGHGTTWQEMARTRWEDWFAEVDRAFDELQARSDEIFLMGLSMGGCLALRLAELRGPAVRGLVLVNPSLTADNKVLFAIIPAAEACSCRRSRASPATSRTRQAAEAGYDRTPVKAAATLPGLWQTTQQHLGELTQPFWRSTARLITWSGPASLKLLSQRAAGRASSKCENWPIAITWPRWITMPRQYLREA